MSIVTRYTVFLTENGWMTAAASFDGLKRLTLPQPTRKHALALLGDSVDNWLFAPEIFGILEAELSAYFQGKPLEFKDPVDIAEATPFQQQVWQVARLIPYGKTSSYARLAEEIGKPGASRAVGQALGKNPLPIIVPCHRVLAGDGKLGGFSGGIEMKRFLLRLEGITV